MSFRLPPARVGVLAAWIAALALAPAAAAQPNIVLVLTDDQRADTLAAMPTVERELVGRGVTFTNAFAVNPLCCPSRVSFLTGNYSHTTNVYDNRPPFGGVTAFDDSSTLATWLAAAGYRTGFIGKYLNGYDQDFVPSGWSRWVGYAGGFYGYHLNVDGAVASFGSDEASYSTDVLTREAVSFVESSPGPFFLVYAPYAPHGPATPAPRDADAFSRLAPWRPPSHDEADVADKPRWVRGFPRLGASGSAAADDFRRRQLASLLAVDDGVGALLRTLRESGRLANTVVVFASDNGLLWGEHRQSNRKTSAYEESIRIPLVVRYDARVHAPRRDSRLVANVDLAPTLAELAGIKAPPVDGQSLAPLLEPGSSAARWRTRLLLEHMRGRAGATAEVPTYCAVRRPELKYVVYSTREEELYDLAADPHELVNRASDPALRRTLLRLRLDAKELCDPPPPGFDLGWLCTVEPLERFAPLLGTARDDTICGHDSLPDAIRARGGDDVVRAGGGADVVHGDDGADRLFPGTGSDRVSGGAGTDAVHARDGRRDRVACGRGRDVVHADRGDVVAGDCEVVRRPPRPAPIS